MKRIIFLIAPFLLSLPACNNVSDTRHLSRAQMSGLLTDIHAAEAYSAVVTKDTAKKGDPKNMDSLAQYYTDIFAHYHISKDQFEKSLEWYKAHPDELDSVYNNMLLQLSKLEGIYRLKK